MTWKELLLEVVVVAACSSVVGFVVGFTAAALLP